MTTTYEPSGMPPPTLLDAPMTLPAPPEELDLLPEAGPGDESSKPKRQVLSCTTCRKRKVKCDRVQPCQACCARGQPKECTFSVSEKDDYEPIKQSYEIRELRKENLRLKEKLRSRRQANSPIDSSDDDEGNISGDRKRPPRVPSKPSQLQQRRFRRTADPSESLYFGSPGLANVIADFANMQLHNRPSASLAHSVPRGVDIFAYQDAPLYPFPTLWRADGGTSVLLNCLPPRTEMQGYLDAFQRRAQSCSFPHVPEEITTKEIDRFLANAEDNAYKHPDMLALIFAALAQGLQNGVYDKSGGEWVEGAMEAEAWKGDLYIAAAMQALRVASFMNRPTLLVIQTLIMIGPYLTNGGKFLDAWATFGLTIRLAQSIGLHRNPKYLDPAPPLRESSIRQSLWWWMLHMDQQYSMTLGRPLGISGIGDCPPPEPLTTNPTILRLSEYINSFTILARQILSSDRLTVEKIDHFTDRLLALRDTLPEIVQFDESWLEPNRTLPEWPLDAQAAVFYGKTHNYLILLNRQRAEHESGIPVDTTSSATGSFPQQPQQQQHSESQIRGRERVLSSARSLLYAFEFFHTRCRPAMICWTMGQQAFNAAMILTLSLLHPSLSTSGAPSMDTRASSKDDYYLVHRTYATFVEMQHKGIHRLAGVACTKLSGLLMQLHSPPSSTSGFGQPPPPPPREVMDTVMGGTGMMLLEDPGLQGFVEDAFAPLGFQMAGGELPPSGMDMSSGLGGSVGTGTGMDIGMDMGMGMGMGIGSPGWAARPAPATTSILISTYTSTMGGTGAGSSMMNPRMMGESGTGGGGYAMMSGGNPGMGMTAFGEGGVSRSGSDTDSGSGSGSGRGSRSDQRPQVGPKPEMLRMPSGSRA